jgi:hypothetical protein
MWKSCWVDGWSVRTASADLHRDPVRDIETAKRKLWHGRPSSGLGRLARLVHWCDACHVRDLRGAVTLRRHISDLIDYLHANRHARVNYGQRCYDELPISAAFAESALNEILSKRMIKKQQMHAQVQRSDEPHGIPSHIDQTACFNALSSAIK